MWLLLTEPFLAIVWDEGYTLGRLDRVRSWIAAMRDPADFARSWVPPTLETVQQDGLPAPRPAEIDTRAELLGSRAIRWFWPFAREEPHGHPPFYALVGLIGDAATPWRAPLGRARFGTMLALSLAAGASYAAARRRWGAWAGAVAAGAMVLQPNLFAHGHYATYDALLTATWVGATLAFAAAVAPRDGGSRWAPRWGALVLFGLLLGAAMDTKLTGWFVPIPMAAWAALGPGRRRRAAATTLALGGAIGLAVMLALCPPFWPDPLGGLRGFFASNLSRGETIPIEVQFLGTVYRTPVASLPWWNTIAWTLFVTPVGVLVLAVVGAGGLLRPRGRPRDDLATLAAMNTLFLLALRALPHTPGHDGVRQFLPAFGGLALLASYGAGRAVAWRPAWGGRAVAAALAEASVSVLVMLPVPLSYFSPAVGGLPGAARLGMEPTYYWDALTPAARDWLGANTPPGGSVLFATNPASWFYLRRTGDLAVPIAPFERGRPSWYVVQNRPGAMKPFERELIARMGPDHVVVAKLGVPLVWAFPAEAAMSASGARP
jgi:4-amino-4-deoxy-L-arabinose transferase-like glycosyltransferase